MSNDTQRPKRRRSAKTTESRSPVASTEENIARSPISPELAATVRSIAARSALLNRPESLGLTPEQMEALLRRAKPLFSIIEKTGSVATRLLTSRMRAEELSEMLRGDTEISALRDTLAKEPINDAMTLLALLSIERDKGASKLEASVASALAERHRAAALKGHAPSHARQEKADTWLDEHFTSECKSYDHAAKKLENILHVSFRTARRYVDAWKKSRATASKG